MEVSYEFKRAHSILYRIFYKKDHIEPILSSLESPYGKRSLQRVTDLTYGVARWNLYLEELIKKVSHVPFERIEREVLLILKIALYQMVLNPLRPDYAIVDEAVEFAKEINKKNSANFINAVLRKIKKKSSVKRNVYEFVPLEEKFSIKYSHPIFLVKRWIKNFGIRGCEEILKENQKIPKIDLLVNIKKIDLNKMEELLLKNNIISEKSLFCPAGLKILKGNPLKAPDEIRQNFYVMDLTAQGFAYFFSMFGGNSLLDLASAPGGKSLCVRIFHKYKIHICSDLFFARIFKVKKNFSLFDEEVFLLLQTIIKPAIKAEIFDRIILDAPCSGTGVLRKNPEAKWRLKEKDFEEFKKKQIELLKESLNLLCKGGYLLYMTCSLEPEENEEVVFEVLKKEKNVEVFKDYKDFSIPLIDYLSPKGFIRIFPKEELDGMSGVILYKKKY